MPEGDTLHRAAARLDPALRGRVVTRYRAYRPELLFPDRTGRRVLGVEARGKNLLVHFDDRRTLWTHLGMSGLWQLTAPGERWRRPAHRARVVIANEVAEAVCFDPPDVALLTEPELARHRVLAGLGPDLLAPEFDRAEALRRLTRDGARPLGEAILDQRLVAGIGNVYKSEMLFLTRLDPRAPVGTIATERLDVLLRATRRMMQRNLGPHPRRTREGRGPRYWVYGRAGLGCPRCHARIEMQRQGTTGRSSYFCPRCASGPGVGAPETALPANQPPVVTTGKVGSRGPVAGRRAR